MQIGEIMRKYRKEKNMTQEDMANCLGVTAPAVNKFIRVAAAIIIHNDKIFATQRGYGQFKDGWEFPGGKIEPGETPQEALVREIQEELDSVVEVGELFETVEYDYPQFHLSMDCFLCKLKEGKLVLKEHEAARWLSREELDTVDWLPADIGVIQRLKEMCL